MFQKFKELFSQINSLQSMTSLDEVKSSVPSSAVYVTLVDMLVLDKPVQTSGIEYDGPLMKRTIINAGNEPLNSAYMVHDSRELLFLKGGNTIFSTPLQNIASLQSLQSLDGYKKYTRGGFVCNLRDGRSILLSTPVGVMKDETMEFRTISGTTDLTGGWSEELSPYGIKTFY